MKKPMLLLWRERETDQAAHNYYYKFQIVEYDAQTQTAVMNPYRIYGTDVNGLTATKNLVIINAKMQPGGKMVYIDINDENVIDITTKAVRRYVEMKYGTGTDLCGHCIEASELIVAILRYYNINANTVEGWCNYDDGSFCSDRPYDAHTWVETDDFYIDVTADQFNYGMYTEHEFPPVLVNQGLPHGMCYEEPVESID